MSGSVGCGRLVSRLNVTPVPVSDGVEFTGALTASDIGGATGASATSGDGAVAGLSGVPEAVASPFIERVLKSSLVADVSSSSSRVRQVISAIAEEFTVIVGILSISTPEDAEL